MMLLWLWSRLSCDPFDDGQQPRPIFVWTDESECVPEFVKIVNYRYASTGGWLPSDVGFDDLAVDPCGRRAGEQVGVMSQEEGEEFRVAIL